MASDHPAAPAGSSTWQFVLQYQGSRILSGLVGLVFLVVIAKSVGALSSPTRSIPPGRAAIALFIVAVAMFTAKRLADHFMDHFLRREYQAKRGAVAEESVGSILDRLPKDQHVVLHDVKVARGNIDHLVFRRDGAIFLIETKSHRCNVTKRSDQIYRDGQPFEKDIVKQALSNIYDLQGTLKQLLKYPPWITTVIVFTNAWVPLRCEVHKISVINVRYLDTWMSRSGGNWKTRGILWPQIEVVRKSLTC